MFGAIDALSGSKLPGQEVHMSSHLEVSKPSGRELIPLSGQRVTLGKASTNDVALEHDETVSRLHAVFENLGFAWSLRDLGSRNGTFLNGEKITAERVLRSGDEVRVGKSRLLFWEVKETKDGRLDEETVTAQPMEQPPRLTRRELDVLVVLCRPLVSDDPFPEPASVKRMAGELYVTEAAVKQHLQNLYDKFTIPAEGDRRVRLANEALRRGAVTLAQLREGTA
jgi:pSer/pThr/pTyr-binding forkhead associated (FHA) protein